MASISNPNPQAQQIQPQSIKPVEKKPMGTGFTNINRVLEANKQNKLGSTIAGNIKQQAAGVVGGVQQQANQFNTQAQNARIDTEANKNLRSSTLSNIVGTNPTAGQPNTSSGVNDNLGDKSQPTGSAVVDRGVVDSSGTTDNTQSSGFQSPDDKTIQAFQEMQSGAYKGPMGLDENQTTQLQRQGQDVGQLGQLTGTSAGRQTLLQRIVGNPGYTAGQQKMDTLLLGQSGKDLNQVRRDTKGLTNALGTEISNAGNLAQQYQRGNEAFGKETQQMVGGALTGQTDAQKAAYDKTIADAQAQFGQLYGGLQGVDSTVDMSKRGQLTPEQFKNMGIDTSTEEGASKAAVLNGLFALSNRESADQVKLNLRQYTPEEAKQIALSKQYTTYNPTTGKTGFTSAGAKQSSIVDQYNKLLNGYSYAGTGSYMGGKGSSWTPGGRVAGSQAAADAFLAPYLDKYNPVLTGTVNKGAGNFTDYTNGQSLSPEMLKQMGYGAGSIASITKKQNENVDWENLLGSDVLSTGKDAQGNLTYTPTKTMTELSSADQLRKINALRQLGTDKATPLYSEEELANAGKVNTNAKFDYDRAKGRIQGVSVTPDMKLDLSNMDPSMVDMLASTGQNYGQKYGEGMTNLQTLGLAKNTPLPGIVGDLTGGLGMLAGGGIGIVADPIANAAGTVICTELYKQGLMSEDIYRKDVVFGQKQSPKVIKGYHLWAKPLVKLMQKSTLVTKIVNIFAQPWSKEMAYGNNKVGKVLMFIGLPICRVLGWF
jgi:hypothetical protein